MRKQWFGDSRDYAKWSFIINEASKDAVVCCVAMARPDILSASIHPRVLSFFDRYKNLDLVRELFQDRYRSVSTQYYKSLHESYFDEVMLMIRQAQLGNPVLVFVDPDTGIEPVSSGSNKHVRLADLRRVSEVLRPGDKLVVYQHAPIMRKPNWIDSAMLRLSGQPWLADFRLRSHYDQACASDVCFLVVERIAGT